MTIRVGSAPASSRTRNWSSPTAESTPCVVMANPVRRDARAAARCTRSSWAVSQGLSVPISPMMPGRTPLSPDPAGDLVDKLVGQRIDAASVDARLGRVVGLAIPATAHHHVQAAGGRDRSQPLRVAADAGRRQVHDRPAARRPEPGQLLEDDRLVAGELPVVPAVGDVPQRDLRVLVGQGDPEGRGVDRSKDRLDVRHRS